MSIRVTVEGDEQKVKEYLRDSQQDRRYKSYHQHEFLIGPSEVKVEHYVERLNRRIQQLEKNRVSKITIKTPEAFGSKKIEFDLLDARQVDLLDGKMTIHGKSYDPYSDPNPDE